MEENTKKTNTYTQSIRNNHSITMNIRWIYSVYYTLKHTFIRNHTSGHLHTRCTHDSKSVRILFSVVTFYVSAFFQNWWWNSKSKIKWMKKKNARACTGKNCNVFLLVWSPTYNKIYLHHLEVRIWLFNKNKSLSLSRTSSSKYLLLSFLFEYERGSQISCRILLFSSSFLSLQCKMMQENRIINVFFIGNVGFSPNPILVQIWTWIQVRSLANCQRFINFNFFLCRYWSERLFCLTFMAVFF